MKRAKLHSIISYTMVIMTVLIVPLHGQIKQEGSFVSQNFTLSDFGDGYDNAKSLIWKPAFSEFVAQVPGEAGAADPAAGEAAVAGAEGVVQLGQNPDPARSTVRYAQNKPDGITDFVGGPQQFVLGVKAEFTQQGYNWIELRPYTTGDAPAPAAVADPAAPAAAGGAQAEANLSPEDFLLKTSGAVDTAPDTTVEGEVFEIPFAGRATDVTVWVWGGHYGWWLEAYLNDYLGYEYRIPMGDLMYTGWKQKRAAIPESIIQKRNRLPATQSLVFEMFKLWSFPNEKVDQFYVYFDLLQQGSVVSTEIFNGKQLELELW